MNIKQTVKKLIPEFIKDVRYDILYALRKRIPVEKYPEELVNWYEKASGEYLDLNNPITYNQKIQWLKLYDNFPMKKQLADKYRVREWVSSRIGDDYLIPLLGLYSSANEIDFEKLPNQFILQCNHGSNMHCIISDKSQANEKSIKRYLNKCLKRDYSYATGFELQYRGIKPYIIAEEYLQSNDVGLTDYKFLCFNGEPHLVWVDSGRYVDHRRTFFDLNWNRLNISNNGYLINEDEQKPENFTTMIELARNLSEGFNYVRVDFYNVEGTIYFGEMTFTSASGLEFFKPDKYNVLFGEKIKLGKKRKYIDPKGNSYE